jgi:hypothetical protein
MFAVASTISLVCPQKYLEIYALDFFDASLAEFDVG